MPSGDDAAVVAADALAVTSVDMMVEGVHFELAPGWASPADVGHRALAAALSDIAAMGSRAGEAYIALGLPARVTDDEVLELVDGAGELARRCGVTIAGGDIVAAPALTVCVTAVGWSSREVSPVTRAGARAGDIVGVTGRLGGPAGALELLAAGREPGPELLARLRRPEPRLAAGAAVAAAGAHAMIDVSDGLAADASLLGRASGVRLRIELERLPLLPAAADAAAALGRDGALLAAESGEEFELCICAAAADADAVAGAAADAGGPEVTWIGEVRAGDGGADLAARDGTLVAARGYEHRV